MKTWKTVLIAIVIAVAAFLIYGLIEPYLLDVEEEEAAIPNLPAEWEGQEIAVFGDFQVGMWLDNKSTVEEAVEKIVDRDPAAVLILGDFIYHPEDQSEAEVAQAVEVLRPIGEADIPVYTVLGNHDYGLDKKEGNPSPETVERLRNALADMGIEVLHNEAVALDAEGAVLADGESGLYIAGIGSEWAEEDVPAAAFEEIPDEAPRVALMHNPNSFEEIPVDSAPLAVAGHTHGGQISLPGLPQWSWVALTSEEPVHIDGWADSDYGAEGNRLYINRGIGMSAVPIRFNAKPELTFFTLNAAE
ncbi:metallophosphoesterase [Planococcus lenghuensis]|uniref:Metallophosphoesterase n=1 Tax=Planococcus lenghuensis TaxID=2213202 RepID=A0A1Q2L0E0_9BACL|nr:metallophosphoesterase [Planococcus lenghuensis]AQQ53908.1 metallophosphoesterase [Planococcus lenghuensis]